jgi:DNA modification methylase
MERRCFGLEIDPKYCDAIVRRYIAFVGADKVDEGLKAKYLKEVKNGK